MSFKEVLHTPTVYIWWRGSACMYVGKTMSILQRFLDHHVIDEHGGRINDRPVAGDEVSLHLCASSHEALVLEAALIERYKPVYNTQNPSLDAALVRKAKAEAAEAYLQRREEEVEQSREARIAENARITKKLNRLLALRTKVERRKKV